MKNLLRVIIFLFINVSVFSQTKEERLEIVKSYDKDLINYYKKELKESLEAQNLFKTNFLKNNSNIPLTYITPNGDFAELQYIEKDGTPIYYSTDNTGSGITSRANNLYSGGLLGLNINGEDMIAGVWDGGAVRTTHEHFSGRVVQRDAATALSNHATHVTGTIVGNGPDSSMHRGIAYQGSAWTHDWNSDTSEAIERAEEGLLVSNHSYGFGVFDSNGILQLPVYYFGAYIQTSRNWDLIMNMYPNYLYVTAAGNDRSSSAIINGKNGYDLLTGTKLAKNGLTVGAVNQVSTYLNSGSVIMSSFSNWGPTDDGRIKPDVVTKGTSVLSSSSSSDTGTATMSGTSMSSPGITGTLLLIQQHYKNIFGRFMRASTLKGVTLHTADEAGSFTGPDYEYGWGLINASAAATTITSEGLSTVLKELILNPGQTYSLNVKAIGGTTPLMASISWTDLPGVVNTGVIDEPTPVLVNDLDIRVTKAAQINLPWKLDPVIPFNPAIKGDNIVDPFEKVQVDNTVGDYVITVSHKGTLAVPQKFALVVTGVDSKFTFRTTANTKTACNNQTAIFNFRYTTTAILPTNFTITNLPVGAIATFSNSTLTSNGNFNITISNLTNVIPGTYTMEVIGNNGEEIEKVNVYLIVYSANFTDVTNQVPVDYATEQPIYSNLNWNVNANAVTYDVQIATNNTFSTITESANVASNSYLTNNLIKNTQYFWRVRSVNSCGISSYSPTKTFFTVNLTCDNVVNNTVIPIAEVANTVITSTIIFNNPLITSIYDIDVAVNITHTYVQDMTLKLTSPQGNIIILQQEACGDEDNMNVIYDDNGGFIVCSTSPPGISGRIKPVGLLSSLNGLNPNGTWTLEVNDPWDGDGGTLNSWSINVCKQVPSTLSNDDFAFNQISVWPNPAKNQVNISINLDSQEQVDLELFDIQGRLINKEKMNNTLGTINQIIDITNLPNGLYLLKITQGNKKYNSKIVKQ